jgi:hypothetical protein
MSPAGRAPEALQAEHLAALRGSNAEPSDSIPAAPVAGIPTSPPPPPPAAPAPPSETVAATANPLLVQLETLPDEDLAREAQSKGIRIDGRWGRERLIYEIVQAAANPPPPPPATTQV